MKRSRMDLLHDMLRVTQAKGGRIKPTHLLYKANLSHEALRRYVRELIDGGLLAEEKQGTSRMYVLTEKGHRFLQEYRQLTAMAETFGI